ncbi:MAG TPA: hypothetical protein VG186_12915 [Solirubrobacteraceae bacterium]|nr:hypothetical protein [Solirubrobacteraceae bacterium]
MVAAVATVLGLSLSLATPEVTAAGTGSETAVVTTTIGGIADGKPRLRFAVATQGGFPVTAVDVTLPSGLAFSTKASDIDHGVRVGTAAARSSVRKGALTVTLHQAAPSFVLTVAGSALTESTKLEAAATKLVLYNRSHLRHEHTLPLKLLITLERGTHTALKLPDTIAFR